MERKWERPGKGAQQMASRCFYLMAYGSPALSSWLNRRPVHLLKLTLYRASLGNVKVAQVKNPVTVAVSIHGGLILF